GRPPSLHAADGTCASLSTTVPSGWPTDGSAAVAPLSSGSSIVAVPRLRGSLGASSLPGAAQDRPDPRRAVRAKAGDTSSASIVAAPSSASVSFFGGGYGV